jgi:glycerol uptake facilitator protein
MFVQQIAGGTVKWSQLPVYLAAELLAGIVAALLYGVLTRTPAEASVAAPGLDLGDPDPQLSDGRQATTV